jgi:hypothetical protein
MPSTRYDAWSGVLPAMDEVAYGTPEADSALATLRDRKLGRLTFRYSVTEPRAAGDAASFLLPTQIEEFHIPDEVPVSAHPYSPPILG